MGGSTTRQLASPHLPGVATRADAQPLRPSTDHAVLPPSSLRRSLAPYCDPPSARAVVAVLDGVAFYLAFVAGALLLHDLRWRVACAIAIAPAAGRLFMRAHDAAHGSLTSSPALNQVLGRIAFLPTFHPMSHWALLHNRRHHVFTNLRSRDVVWAPLSPREYADLPPWRQARYRLYRTTAGFGLYHLVELWWKHFLFPRRAAIGTRTAVNLFDQLLVGAFFAGLTLAAGTTADWRPVPWLESLALVVALPLALFCSIAGFVSYFHHTHPDIPWFDDPATWRRDSDQLGTSLQLSFSPLVGRILGDVMEHPAHHLEPRISLARLREAQAHLSALVGDAGVSQRWTWRAHRQIVAACKLYDFERGCWCDFSGRATAGR